MSLQNEIRAKLVVQRLMYVVKILVNIHQFFNYIFRLYFILDGHTFLFSYLK